MLIISSLADACSAFVQHRPSRVISLLSEDECLPCFDGLGDERHLKLYVERESCARSISDAARTRSAEIVNFIRDWDGAGGMLVHCNRGVSRSTAAAFIVQCMCAPTQNETAIAAALRRAAPFADPCPLLVSYADEILGRDGRMAEAVDDLPPPCVAIRAPITTIALHV